MIAANWFNPAEGKSIPGLNVAFIFSFLLALLLVLLVVWYGRRRPKGTPCSWGEAMIGSVYAFAVMCLGFGIVPDAWIKHASNDLGWDRQKLIYGPGGILKPRSAGGWNPLTLQYEIVRDTIVVLIYVYFFVLMCLVWAWWQRRGESSGAKALPTSSYGRPLVKKS